METTGGHRSRMKIDQTRTLQLLDQRIIRLNRPCFHGCYPTVWDASPLHDPLVTSLRSVPRRKGSCSVPVRYASRHSRLRRVMR